MVLGESVLPGDGEAAATPEGPGLVIGVPGLLLGAVRLAMRRCAAASTSVSSEGGSSASPAGAEGQSSGSASTAARARSRVQPRASARKLASGPTASVPWWQRAAMQALAASVPRGRPSRRRARTAPARRAASRSPGSPRHGDRREMACIAAAATAGWSSSACRTRCGQSTGPCKPWFSGRPLRLWRQVRRSRQDLTDVSLSNCSMSTCWTTVLSPPAISGMALDAC
mmetsp:Transcript_61204/g.197195  ORF Transcript_61204/g.197195 Transcript_61204/m.197195 type:complete len:227 (+) Transcript_61204:658-1338(+)